MVLSGLYIVIIILLLLHTRFICMLIAGRDPKNQLQLIAALSIPGTDEASLLMKQMLIETPRARVTAEDALKDEYFEHQGFEQEVLSQLKELSDLNESDVTVPAAVNETLLNEQNLLQVLEQETAVEMT